MKAPSMYKVPFEESETAYDHILQRVKDNIPPLESVMLVDDDEATNYMHRLLIQEVNVAKKIETFLEGASALSYLKTCQRFKNPIPDLIFLDLNMPEMDGFQFLSEFMELPVCKEKKIVLVLLTGSLDPKDRSRALAFSCVDHFVTKKMSSELIAEVIYQNFPRLENHLLPKLPHRLRPRLS